METGEGDGAFGTCSFSLFLRRFKESQMRADAGILVLDRGFAL